MNFIRRIVQRDGTESEKERNKRQQGSKAAVKEAERQARLSADEDYSFARVDGVEPIIAATSSSSSITHETELLYLSRFHTAPSATVATTPLWLSQRMVARLQYLEAKQQPVTPSNNNNKQSQQQHLNYSSSTLILIVTTLKALEVVARTRTSRRSIVESGGLTVLGKLFSHLARSLKLHMMVGSDQSLSCHQHHSDDLSQDLECAQELLPYVAASSCGLSSCFEGGDDDDALLDVKLYRSLLFAAIDSIAETTRRMVEFHGGGMKGSSSLGSGVVFDAASMLALRRPLSPEDVVVALRQAGMCEHISSVLVTLVDCAEHCDDDRDLHAVLASSGATIDVLKFWVQNEKSAEHLRNTTLRTMIVRLLGFPAECRVDGDGFASLPEARLARYLHLQVSVLDLASVVIESHPSQLVELVSFGFSAVLRDTILWLTVYFPRATPTPRAAATTSLSSWTEFVCRPLDPTVVTSRWSRCLIIFDALRTLFAAIQQVSVVWSGGNCGDATAPSLPVLFRRRDEQQRERAVADALSCIAVEVFSASNDDISAVPAPDKKKKSTHAAEHFLTTTAGIAHYVLVESLCQLMHVGDGDNNNNVAASSTIVRALLDRSAPALLLSERVYFVALSGTPSEDPLRNAIVSVICTLGTSDSAAQHVLDAVVSCLEETAFPYPASRIVDMCTIINYLMEHTRAATVSALCCNASRVVYLILTAAIEHARDDTEALNATMHVVRLVLDVEEIQARVLDEASFAHQQQPHDSTPALLSSPLLTALFKYVMRYEELRGELLSIVLRLFLHNPSTAVDKDTYSDRMWGLVSTYLENIVVLAREGGQPETERTLVALLRLLPRVFHGAECCGDTAPMHIDELQALFVRCDAYVYIVSLLSRSWFMPPNEHEGICVVVLQSLACLMHGHRDNRRRFLRAVNQEELVGSILIMVREAPSEGIVRQLFSMICEQPWDSHPLALLNHATAIIRHEALLPTLCAVLAHAEPGLLKLALDRLTRMMLCSTQNVARACSVKLFEEVVPFLCDAQSYGEDVHGHVADLLCALGSHHLTVPELKLLLRSVANADAAHRGQLLNHVVHFVSRSAQQCIAAMITTKTPTSPDEGSESESVAQHTSVSAAAAITLPAQHPHNYFVLSGSSSGIDVHRRNSTTLFSGSSGFTIELVVSFDGAMYSQLPHRSSLVMPSGVDSTTDGCDDDGSLSNNDDEDLPATAQRLFSVSFDDDTAAPASFYEVVFRSGYLEIASGDAREVLRQYRFAPRQWYVIHIMHSPGRRLLSRPELRLFVGGDLVASSMNVPYPKNSAAITARLAIGRVARTRPGTGEAATASSSSCLAGQLAAFRFYDTSSPSSLRDSAGEHVLLTIKPHLVDGNYVIDAGTGGNRQVVISSSDVYVAKLVQPGTTVCLTNTIIDAMDCIGGLHHVLLPLLASVHNPRVAFTAERESVRLPPEPVPDAARLVHHLLHLLCAMVNYSPHLVQEVEERRVIPLLGDFLRDLGPQLDTDVVQGLRAFLIALQPGTTTSQTRSTAAACFTMAVRHLVLNMAVWCNVASVDVVPELMGLVRDVASDERTFPFGKQTLTRLGALMVLLQSVRLYYRRGNKSDAATRDAIFKLCGTTPALLPVPIASADDIRVVLTELNLLATTVETNTDEDAVFDALKFFADLQRRHLPTATTLAASAHFFALCHGNGVLGILKGIITSCPTSTDARNLAMVCVGQHVVMCEESVQAMFTSLPFGLAIFGAAMKTHGGMPDNATYYTLRSIMIGENKFVRSGSSASVRLLQGHEVIALPSAVAVVLQLIQESPAQVQQVVLQDLVTLTCIPKNCDLILAGCRDATWQTAVMPLIPAESDKAGEDGALVVETVLDFTKNLCYHALTSSRESSSTNAVSDVVACTLAVMRHHNLSHHVQRALMGRILDLYIRHMREHSFAQHATAEANYCELVLLYEQTFCYRDEDTDEVRLLHVVGDGEDGFVKVNTSAAVRWHDWGNVDKLLRIFFQMKLHRNISRSNVLVVVRRLLRLLLELGKDPQTQAGALSTTTSSHGSSVDSGMRPHRQAVLDNHLRFVEDIVSASSALPSSDVLQHETYELLGMLMISLRRYAAASSSSRRGVFLAKIVQRLRWLVLARRGVLQLDPCFTPELFKAWDAADKDMTYATYTEEIEPRDDWSRLQHTFDCAVDRSRQRVLSNVAHVQEICDRRQHALHRETGQRMIAKADAIQQHLAVVAIPSYTYEANYVEQWAEDEAASALRYWRKTCKHIWAERSPWCQHTHMVPYVKLSRAQQRLGVRFKLRLDPSGTNHPQVTNSGAGRGIAALAEQYPTPVAPVSNLNEEEDDALSSTAMLGSTSTNTPVVESSVSPVRTSVPTPRTPPPPAPANDTAQLVNTLCTLKCEVSHMLHVYSGVVRVTREYVSIHFDEVNTSYNQRTAAEAEVFVRKPPNLFWSTRLVTAVYPLRRFRMVFHGLEIHFQDKTAVLINLPYGEKDVKSLHKALQGACPKLLPPKQCPGGVPLERVTERWRRRELSTFDYLMELNWRAHRTVSDTTQYPIFPWVLSDYTSPTLELSDPNVYRDLSRPIGTCGGPRSRKAEEIEISFRELAANELSEPHHYFSYCSNMATVLYFLIRVEPYTTMHVCFEGGKFNLPERLFHSISNTWNGVTTNNQDNKELVPEAYYLPEFALNNNSVRFTTCPENSSVDMNDGLKLPPWAQGSAHRFVAIMREALESEHVSMNINHWIDLIFGYKQRGREAVKALNTYFPDCYYEPTKKQPFSSLDEHVRHKIVDAGDNLGQVPVRLFRKAHVSRSPIRDPIFAPLQHAPLLGAALMLRRARHVDMRSPIVALGITRNDRLIVVSADGRMQLHRMSLSTSPYTVGQIERSLQALDDMASDPGSTPRDGASSTRSSRVANALRGAAGALGGGSGGPLPFNFDLGEVTMRSPALLSRFGAQRGGGNETQRALCLAISDQVLLFSSSPREDACYVTSLEWPRPERLTGHHDLVTATCVSSDNAFLVTGSRDTTCIIWDLNPDAKPVATRRAMLYGHESSVCCLATSVELDTVASGSTTGVVLLHTLLGGKYERTIRHPEAVAAVAGATAPTPSPDGPPTTPRIDCVAVSARPFAAVFFTSSFDSAVYAYSINARDGDAGDGACVPLWRLSLTVRVSSMLLSPDGLHLVLGCGHARRNDPHIVVCETTGLRLVCRLRADNNATASVTCLLRHPGNPQATLVGLDDGTCLMLGVSTQQYA
eukprot:PhM_4_TR18597/c0_g1_i1/m.96986